MQGEIRVHNEEGDTRGCVKKEQTKTNDVGGGCLKSWSYCNTPTSEKSEKQVY
jgi:hypothetical protein